MKYSSTKASNCYKQFFKENIFWGFLAETILISQKLTLNLFFFKIR